MSSLRVIASEAKQSFDVSKRLLRRFAPRNDTCWSNYERY